MTTKVPATTYCKETIQSKKNLEIAWLDLASRLKEIRDKELFLGQWDSFEDFLDDPAMAMDKATASKMITIHERLILEYGFQPKELALAGGWSKISEVLPVITDKESAKEWLEQCGVLSKADLRKEVKEARSGISEIDCRHANTYTIEVCRDCGIKMENHK